jgi:hypothetical protein
MGNLPNINCQYYDRRGGCLFPENKGNSCCRIELRIDRLPKKCKYQLNYIKPPPPPAPPPKKPEIIQINYKIIKG